MKLANEVRIGRPAAEVFDALLDVERVAGCMPGSSLTGKTAADTYAGEVKVKVGPLSAAYAGTVRYVDVDREERRITLKASGKEKGGQGNADAHVVASVLADGEGATVAIDTDLMVRGKVARFGSGVIGEVSERLIGQFADNIERLLSGEPAPATATASSEERQPQQAPDSALDGMSLVLTPLLKRAAPFAAGAAAGLLIAMGLRRGGKQASHRTPHRPVQLVPGTAYLLLPVETHRER